MANNKKENKIEKFTKEAIGKTLNQFNKEIGIADLVEVNKNQDRILNGILSQVNDENTEKTEKSNIITLDNSTDGIVELKEIQGDTNVNVSKIEEMPITHDIGDKEGNVFTLNEIPKGAISIGEIQGNTMVNCNKDDKKELVLMKDLSTQGDNNITLTEGVDGGKVDVALEGNTLVNVSKTKDDYITHEREEDTTGNHIALADEGYIRPVLNGKTMVNVCDQKDPIAVTKAYTVENSGNHIALQGDIDGSCRPVLSGNTLVNLVAKLTPPSSPTTDKFESITKEDKGNYVQYTLNNALADSTTDSVPIADWAGRLQYGLKGNTTYTILVVDCPMTSNMRNYNFRDYANGINYPFSNGSNKVVFTTQKDFINNNFVLYAYSQNSYSMGDSLVINFPKHIIILEGDYSDKPIPDYFEGLQSSFEDNLVTQEMVDSGEEEESNLGKYKVEYKVTGKNKLNLPSATTVWADGRIAVTDSNIVTFTPDNNDYQSMTYQTVFTEVNFKKGTQLTLSATKVSGVEYTSGNYAFGLYLKDVDGNIITDIQNTNCPDFIPSSVVGSIKTTTMTLTQDVSQIGLYAIAWKIQGTSGDTVFKLQLEYGDTATSYEPYKEYTKTLYLNSPLLEGDTIEERNGKVTHVHRYGTMNLYDCHKNNTVWHSDGLANGINWFWSNTLNNGKFGTYIIVTDNTFSDKIAYIRQGNAINIGFPEGVLTSNDDTGVKNWIRANDPNVVYKLKTPQYETISEDSIVCDSYVSGHLDFNTAVPIEKVEFKNTILENKYLYTNTEYTIQFEADKEGRAVISLGGTTLAETTIVKGLNKITITTPETLTDNNLVLEGIGFNISDIVVTPTIEQDFGYFSGLSSTFESELITQEMIDSGEEEESNLGKYKVEYRTTGKNKWRTDLIESFKVTEGEYYTYSGYLFKDLCPDLVEGHKYRVSFSYDKTGYEQGLIGIALIPYINITSEYFTYTKDMANMRVYFYGGNLYNTFTNIQIEEGTKITSYEPYKEYTKTLYLNSPLLEGDTIEEKDGGIYHVHRYKEVVLDGSSFNNMDSDMNGLHRYYSYDYRCLNYALADNKCYCDKLPVSTIPKIDGSITFSGSGYIEYATTKSMSEAQEWLQQNSVTIVYELAEPQYELIEQSNLAVPSYSNGHLDLASAVPVSKVNFLHFEEELTYLYPSTSYTIQFISDKAITVDITLGGTQLLAQSIVKGLNRISITTPATLANNKLIIDGVGANISDVVVTDSNREFMYFEGMKSVGECEDNGIKVVAQNKNLLNGIFYENVAISANGTSVSSSGFVSTDYIKINPKKDIFINVIGATNNDAHASYYRNDKTYISRGFSVNSTTKLNIPTDAQYMRLQFYIAENQTLDNIKSTVVSYDKREIVYIPHQSNTQQLTHEPLRAVGDAKDRYVLINGKWYIERNCKEMSITEIKNISGNVKIDSTTFDTCNDIRFFTNEPLHVSNPKVCPQLFSDFKYRNGTGVLGEAVVVPGNTTIFIFHFSKDITTVDDFVSIYGDSKVVFPITSPVYEPINYNPLEVYSDVTHISTNSAIPTNITIKNHGFNCLLKPSTTYTVSSNLGLNTVTTGADIGDSCLRFYDEDTSDKTTMKDVLVLEGDWTSKADLVPSNFNGIESCFEQALVTDENDVNYGKYKVTAKVVGKNLFNKEDNWIKGCYLDGDDIKFNDNAYYNPKYLKVNPNETYYSIHKDGTPMNISYLNFYDKNKNFIKLTLDVTQFTIPSNAYYIRVTIWNNNIEDNGVIGENFIGNSTTYEPYKESNIVFYIDEPLRGVKDVKDRIFIKGDKVIVQRNCDSTTFDGSNDEWYIWETDNNIIRFALAIDLKCPYHNYTNPANYIIIDKFNRIVYSNNKAKEGFLSHISETIKWIAIAINKYKLATPDVAGFRQWLQQNPVTVVYQLAEPVYEEVEYSSNRLILDTFNNESFNNSTLFLDTNISPKLSFKPLYEELVYVKNSTKYYIQFNAVGSGEVVINLGGTELTTEIVEGYNCIPITTPNESTNLMTIIGQGITISEVVVSEVICGGYYKGLQSCFEEHMENGKYRVLLRGIALDGSKVNGIKLYINEPLRGVEDTKDRLCIKNGKLMVERKCGSAIFDGSDDEGWKHENIRFSISISNVVPGKFSKAINNAFFTTDYIATGNQYDSYIIINGWNGTNKLFLRDINKFINLAELKQYLQQNPLTIVYKAYKPIYEEVTNEYGLPIVFEGYENGIVYIDSAVTPTTHIKYTSNNQLATTLSEAEEQNISTQEDINMNVITYMMDIDMMLTDMEMSNDISVMAVRRDSSNENMLDRMSDEDKKVYRDNTVVMLEKMITANVLEKEDIERRINMYYDKNRISKEQYKYLKSLL